MNVLDGHIKMLQAYGKHLSKRNIFGNYKFKSRILEDLKGINIYQEISEQGNNEGRRRIEYRGK